MISEEIFSLIKQKAVPGGTRENLYGATVLVDWNRAKPAQQLILTDAQTSGGLLLCVAESKLTKVLEVLRKASTPCAAVIGRLARPRRSPLICMTK